MALMWRTRIESLNTDDSHLTDSRRKGATLHFVRCDLASIKYRHEAVPASAVVRIVKLSGVERQTFQRTTPQQDRLDAVTKTAVRILSENEFRCSP
jgi:hypothetical protein